MAHLTATGKVKSLGLKSDEMSATGKGLPAYKKWVDFVRGSVQVGKDVLEVQSDQVVAYYPATVKGFEFYSPSKQLGFRFAVDTHGRFKNYLPCKPLPSVAGGQPKDTIKVARATLDVAVVDANRLEPGADGRKATYFVKGEPVLQWVSIKDKDAAQLCYCFPTGGQLRWDDGGITLHTFLMIDAVTGRFVPPSNVNPT